MELTIRLKMIHPELQWEIGPGLNKSQFFAFSPNLKYELLELTKELSKRAPEMADWEFLSAKPKKRWSKRNIKFSAQGQAVEVNCDNWRYYLTSFNDDEFFDVNLVPDSECAVVGRELNYAADLFVEFELGEELYIKAIDRVNVISPGELEVETDSVEWLNEHVLSEWDQSA